MFWWPLPAYLRAFVPTILFTWSLYQQASILTPHKLSLSHCFVFLFSQHLELSEILMSLSVCCLLYPPESKLHEDRAHSLSLGLQHYQIGNKCSPNIYWADELHSASHNELRKQHPKVSPVPWDHTSPGTLTIQKTVCSQLLAERANGSGWKPSWPSRTSRALSLISPHHPESEGRAQSRGPSCRFINKSGLTADPRLAYMATCPQLAQLVGPLPVRLANNRHADSKPEQNLFFVVTKTPHLKDSLSNLDPCLHRSTSSQSYPRVSNRPFQFQMAIWLFFFFLISHFIQVNAELLHKL